MKNTNKNLLLLAPALLALTSCVSAPRVARVDRALLASVGTEARATVTEARQAFAAAEDAYAVSQNNTMKAEEQVEVADASLSTERSKLDESKLALVVAEGSTRQELDRAEALFTYSLASADHGREHLALRKRELELAKLKEKLGLEEMRLSGADLELCKAQAVQTVNLVAAQRVPVKDYRNQVYYHREEVEVAKARVRSAESRLDEAQSDIDETKRQLDALMPVTG